MKKVFLLFILIAPTLLGKSQTNIITVIDSENNTPVSYANVCFRELKTNKKHYRTTTKEGKADNPVLNEAKVAISFVGYKTIIDTLYPNESKTIKLEKDLFNLEQVVVTGEVIPTLKDRSIYRVKTITAKEITLTGSTNLSDILLTKPNIRIKTDLILGSNIEMMGMSGENVKVMVDGVPIIGRLSGSIDLSQVNVTNVDHIEMIEGPMSVIYGNNALAGTINIITKTGTQKQAGGEIGTQLESVGKYSGNLSLVKPIRNHTLSFNGFAKYFEGVDFDTDDRSMDWKPTTSYQSGIGYKWRNKNWKVTTKINGYYGTLLVKSDISDDYMVYDTYYYTRRFDVSAGINGKWNENNYLNILAYYNFYDRASREYDKDLTTLEGTWQDKETSQNFQDREIRGIYGYSIPSINLNLQAGIDIKTEEMGGPRLDSTTYEMMGDYAAFLTLKYKFYDKFEIQPGARLAYNTAFNHPLVYSLNLKYSISPEICWRVSAAKGFRAPSLKELYYNFVNTSHDIHGNPDLKAEYSHYANTSLTLKPATSIKISLAGYFNYLRNKIELVENSSVRAGYYSYYNIDIYKSLGGDLAINYTPNKNIKITAGATITGRYNEYSEDNNSSEYKFSPDYLANILIREPRTKLQCLIDYKYNGRKPYFYEDDDDVITEGEQDAYHLLNISVSRSFFDSHIQTTLGARNITDVTSVKTTSETADHGTSTSTEISYGRTFYLQIAYRF